MIKLIKSLHKHSAKGIKQTPFGKTCPQRLSAFRAFPIKIELNCCKYYNWTLLPANKGEKKNMYTQRNEKTPKKSLKVFRGVDGWIASIKQPTNSPTKKHLDEMGCCIYGHKR